MKLNCLIVDDEPMARKGMEEYIREVEFLHLIAKCENPLKATSFLAQHKVDLIFLDIQMPKLSGIEFLRTLKDPPMVIFTTAFSDYALEGYSLDIIDYLVKPISVERFMKAVNKARDFYSLRHKPASGVSRAPDYFFVKSDSKYEKIFYSELLYGEAMQNYVILHTRDRKLIAYMTLSGLENQLPVDQFIKVHKSYIVSIAATKAIEGNDLVVGTAIIPVSRNLKEEVMRRILGDNLLSR